MLDTLSNSRLNEIKSFVLYGNDNMYLTSIANMMIKKMFNKENIITRKTSFSYTNYTGTNIDVEYEYSDYHFELEYSEKHNTFIKSIIKNKNITTKPFVFIIKNMDNTTKISQFALKKMLDNCGSVIYIFLTKCTNKIENALLSRSMIINTHFPIKNIYNVFTTITGTSMNFNEFEKYYYNTHKSIIVLLIQYEHGFIQLRILQHLDKLINTIQKEKKILQSIILIREFIYKAYHITFPLQHICKFIINKFINEKYIIDIINLSAECDYDLVSSNKDILVYEKFFIKLLKIIR